jgi:hypothetical protein
MRLSCKRTFASSAGYHKKGQTITSFHPYSKPCTAGVDPAKIRVVPEAIDTDLWDPARYNPVSLSTLGLVQATGPPCDPNATLPAANNLRGKLPVTRKKPYGEQMQMSFFRLCGVRGLCSDPAGLSNAAAARQPPLMLLPLD